MDLQDVIEEFRSQIDDEAPPYLIGDDQALTYAIDAQDQLVKEMGGISDMTVALADIGSPQTRLQDLAVTAASPWAALSPYILRIRSARLLTAKVDLIVISEGDMPTVRVEDYGWTRGASLDDTDTGDVRYLVTDIREDYVRWLRVPVTTDTVRLHVYRLPYPRISDQESSLEVHSDHHLHLVKWMKYLAYSKQDAEIYDPKQAKENEASFKAYCEKARAEKERRRYKPRVVKYGGL